MQTRMTLLLLEVFWETSKQEVEFRCIYRESLLSMQTVPCNGVVAWQRCYIQTRSGNIYASLCGPYREAWTHRKLYCTKAGGEQHKPVAQGCLWRKAYCTRGTISQAAPIEKPLKQCLAHSGGGGTHTARFVVHTRQRTLSGFVTGAVSRGWLSSRRVELWDRLAC